jgi:2-dehydropantoate 2-reductase
MHMEVRTVTADVVKREYDLVLLACKAYDLESAIMAISPALNDGGAVLPFLNGLASYKKLDAHFSRDRILGGVAYIALSLMPSGEILHSGLQDSVIVGSRASQSNALAQAFYELIAGTPGERRLSAAIEQDLWNKWVMIASGSLMTCLMRGQIGEILKTSDGRSLMKQAMHECSSVARLSGFELSGEAAQNMQDRLLDDSSSWAASMARDINLGAPRIEADDIVGDIITRGALLGADMPLARAAYCHLQVYQARQRV